MVFGVLCQCWHAMPVKNDIEKELTADVWEAFLDDIVTQNAVAVMQTNASSNNPNVSMMKPVSSLVDNTFSSFKWDMKNVPQLPKNKPIQDAYDEWEEDFLVQMTLAMKMLGSNHQILM